jgi:hypothetical protein
MYCTNNLIYIHVQKTAGSHIVKLLARLFAGEETGKHNAATHQQIARGHLFLSSIRNPWDWYLSLWTYGRQQSGAFACRLTQKNLLYPLKSSLADPMRAASYFWNEIQKDTSQWGALYNDLDSVSAFRNWLKAIHSPENRFSMGDGYAKNRLSTETGFFTHRYLTLCCKNLNVLHSADTNPSFDFLRDFERDNCYIDKFIRQENLETDFIDAIGTVREISEAEKEMVFHAKKTNSSRRTRRLEEFYDEETVELVRNRDQLLVEKFGYEFGSAK